MFGFAYVFYALHDDARKHSSGSAHAHAHEFAVTAIVFLRQNIEVYFCHVYKASYY